MPQPKTGATHDHAQLGFTAKDLTIKELFVWNSNRDKMLKKLKVFSFKR